jgi:phage portal protein BeeE
MTQRRRKTPAKNVGAKGVTFTPALNSGVWEFMPAGTKFNYAKEVGNGLGSSVLVSLLCWLMRTFPEAPAIVERRDQEQWRMIWDHPMSKLIRQPNPYYSGLTLWMATVMDFAFGNAYWIKIRNALIDERTKKGEVVQLWWAPAALMQPVFGPQWEDEFVHEYRYTGTISGKPEILDPDDVVHFRFGLNPTNARLGFTPLASMVREIYTDDQASNFTAAILRNLGIIGVVISPKGSDTMPQDKVDQTRDYLEQNFTGDRRGKGLVFGRAIDAQVLSYNLNGFDVGPIRDIAEERLSAALGIPAAVVGFGTGLQQTKVGATMRELIQQAWNGCIMPMQKILASELDRSLLPDFSKNTGIFRSNFDTSEVRALREDQQQTADRMLKLVGGGIARLDEARKELGLEVRPEHEIYYRPTNVTAVKRPDEKPEPVAPPAPPSDSAQPETAPGGETTDESQDAAD